MADIAQQQNLFNDPFEADTRLPRKAERDRAFSKADKWVTDAYTKVFYEFRGKVFGAWDVTKIYEDRHGELSKENKKGIGGLWAMWRHRGVIRVAGQGKRPNGNESCVYEFI